MPATKSRATSQSINVPAPTGGVNLIAPGGQIPDNQAFSITNMVASENGLRSRLGYQEWATGLTGASDNLVRTKLSFTGSTKNGSKDRLFAVTSTGIWDVTASSQRATAAWTISTAYVVGDRRTNDSGKSYVVVTAGTSAGAGGPTGTGANIVDGTVHWDYVAGAKVITFGTQTNDAGYGVGTTYVNSAGHFYLYTDEENGYFVYAESTDTWTKIASGAGPTDVSGGDPTKFAFVIVWKSRVWFIEKESGKSWYLAAGSLYGAATEFDFGNKFASGGPLAVLANWTVDGGAGLDDHLVAISAGGDVVVYQGTDPSSVLTFGLQGVWNVGALPYGRAFTSRFGGDVLILTRRGILPLSKLISGGSVLRTDQYATEDIAPAFNAFPSTTWGLRGWSVRMHPEDNSIIVTIPTGVGLATVQWAMSLANGSWGYYRDLPIYSCEAWEGQFYFGTIDGRVCKNTGYVDGITLADPNSYVPVQYQVITGFKGGGTGRHKQVKMIRPTIRSDGGAPTFRVEARYGFDGSDMAPVSPGAAGSGTWDNATWDTSKWSGEYLTSQTVVGAVGMGTEFAIAMRGAARSRTVLVGFDVLFDQGGFL